MVPNVKFGILLLYQINNTQKNPQKVTIDAAKV